LFKKFLGWGNHGNKIDDTVLDTDDDDDTVLDTVIDDD
jgi:hypothetical protein